MGKVRVILDTDIGDDVDDAYALGLLACSPEVRLEVVTTNTGRTDARAAIARRMLDLAGLEEAPVYHGRPGPDPNKLGEQAAWAQNYHSHAPTMEGAVEELVRRAAAEPGELTLVAIGPLTNVGAALEMDPSFGRNLRRLIIMGGSIVHGYEYGRRVAEYNIVHDTPASQKVFNCGADLVVVPLDATRMQQVTPRRMAQLAVARNPVCDAIVELSALYHGEYPTLHDPRTCAVLLDERLAAAFPARLEVDRAGFTNHIAGEPNCRVVLEPMMELFFQTLWERYLAGPVTRR